MICAGIVAWVSLLVLSDKKAQNSTRLIGLLFLVASVLTFCGVLP